MSRDMWGSAFSLFRKGILGRNYDDAVSLLQKIPTVSEETD